MQAIRSFLVVSLAMMCASEDAVAPTSTCASDGVPDGGDDRCQLLQGGVGIVSHHAGDHMKLAKVQHQASTSTDAIAEGWPDIFKKVAGAIGSTFELERDLEELKKVVGAFPTEVRMHAKELIASVKPNMTIDAVRTQAEHFYIKIHVFALKIWTATTKVSHAFNHGIGKIVPKQFSLELQKLLDGVSRESKRFTNSFNEAAKALMKANHTIPHVCSTATAGLTVVQKQVDVLVQSSLGMSTKGLSKEISEAYKALPGSVKKQVDKFLHKANQASETMKSSMSPTVKEIAHAVNQAFHSYCHAAGDLKSGVGRLEIGLLSVLLLGILGFM